MTELQLVGYLWAVLVWVLILGWVVIAMTQFKSRDDWRIGKW